MDEQRPSSQSTRADIYVASDFSRAVRRLEVTNRADDDEARISIDPDGGEITINDEERQSRISLAGDNSQGDAVVSVGEALDESSGFINLWGSGTVPGTFISGEGRLELGNVRQDQDGGDGGDTPTVVRSLSSRPRVSIEGYEGRAVLGGVGTDGSLVVKGENDGTTAEIRGDSGQFITGGEGVAGSVRLKNEDGDYVGFVGTEGSDLVLGTQDGGQRTVAIRVAPDGTVEFPQESE